MGTNGKQLSPGINLQKKLTILERRFQKDIISLHNRDYNGNFEDSGLSTEAHGPEYDGITEDGSFEDSTNQQNYKTVAQKGISLRSSLLALFSGLGSKRGNGNVGKDIPTNTETNPALDISSPATTELRPSRPRRSTGGGGVHTARNDKLSTLDTDAGQKKKQTVTLVRGTEELDPLALYRELQERPPGSTAQESGDHTLSKRNTSTENVEGDTTEEYPTHQGKSPRHKRGIESKRNTRKSKGGDKKRKKKKREKNKKGDFTCLSMI